MGIAKCDAHVHIFDPERFPYSTPRRFTPGAATVHDLLDHLERTGIKRAVLVQPSVYGENNDCLLDALNSLAGLARGVAVVSASTPPVDFQKMHKLGIRGARVNLVVDGISDPEFAANKIEELERYIPEQWHIQLHVSPSLLETLFSHIANSKRKFVIDHLGLPDISRGIQAFAWQRQLELVRAGNLFVKVSAPYLSSTSGMPYSDLAPFINNLLQIRPDRVIWGSNWPHTQGTRRVDRRDTEETEEFRKFDDTHWLKICGELAGRSSAALLEENARRLYDFI